MVILLSFFIELIKLYLLQRLMGYSIAKKLILPCCVAIASFAAVWFLRKVFSEDEIVILTTLLTAIVISFFIQGRNKLISVFLGVIALWFVDTFFSNIFTILFPQLLGLYVECVLLIILAGVFVVFRLLKKPHPIKFETFNKRQVLLFGLGLFSFSLYMAQYQEAVKNGAMTIISSISGIFLIVISINAGQKRHYKEHANITETMRKNQEQYFKLLLSNEEETRKFRFFTKVVYKAGQVLARVVQ